MDACDPIVHREACDPNVGAGIAMGQGLVNDALCMW